MAIRMGEVDALAEKLNCLIIPADATSVEDLMNVFKTSIDLYKRQGSNNCAESYKNW